jgi:transposase InsO family protein
LYQPRGSSDLQALKQLIEHLRVSFPTAGFVLMYKMLRRLKLPYSRSEVRRAYVEMRILGKKAPARVRTTDSRHEHERYPNIVKNLTAEEPDQIWVADTTEFKAGRRTTYLALLEDVCTRRVVGYALSHSNNTELTIEALEMALRSATPQIHHSDQGKTYASERYTGRLLKLGVVLSMAAAGCAWENGYAERLNRTFKEEEILRSEYDSLSEARACIKAYVKIYNESRLHMSLGYNTPKEAHDEFLRRAS